MEYKQAIRQFLNDLRENYLSSLSTDCVIFGFHDGQLKVLLLRWKETQQWLLPGGRVGNDEALDVAAHRSLGERTGLSSVFLRQFYTFGAVNRYVHVSRDETLASLHWLGDELGTLAQRDVSVGYYALVDFSRVVPTPDLFTDECRWWDIDQIPMLLFDHNEMIDLALKTLRRQLGYQPVGLNLLPDKFTMTELQQLYETILGRSLDRRNFQKRMLSFGVLERLNEHKLGGAHKAPFLYRFNQETYNDALDDGLLVY